MPYTGCFCLIFNSSAGAQMLGTKMNAHSSSTQEVTFSKTSSTSKPNNPKLVAQSPPIDIPPGTIEPTRPTPPLVPSTPPTPLPAPQLEPTQPPPEQPSPTIEVKVTVKSVEVLDSTVFSQAELAEAVKDFVGKTLTFEQLLGVRTALTELYTDRGYTTSGAFLPPQDATDGVIQVQIVEGKLERIEVRGLKRLQNSYVRSRIEAAAQTPVNIRHLESALQLLQLDPLFSRVQAELTAGTAPGRSVLILNLKEAPPLNSALIVDNNQSPSVGSFGGTALLSHNNLLGLGDRLNAEVGLTEGINTYSINYAIPVNASDGTLSFRYNNGDSRIVEQPFEQFDIKGETQTYSLSFRQPLVRTPTKEFALSLSTDLRRSQTFLFDDEPFSFTTGPENGESKVSVIRFSTDWVNRNRDSVLAARSQFSFGLGVLGATVNDTGTDGRFFSWLGQFQWVQDLGNNVTLVTSAATQLTGDSLLPLEQFSIGGVDTVRGYRTNQRVGDNGAIGSVEVRIPVVRSDSFGVLQVVPFVDAGTIWSNEDERNIDSKTLVSTGFGLRWRLGDRLSARLDWGIPLVSIEDLGDSLQDDGIYFSISVQPL